MNYYNESNPFAANWLRNLINAGAIPKGKVDDRSIEEVAPKDLDRFVQCHFFAGIGGWPHALRLAGWPEDREVWTGSCPCQPFSNAGRGSGVDDERHLWPAFRWLIAQRRPTTVFGEQVASKAGRDWLTGVRFDLEAMGYGVGAADLCAAGIGAIHIRQRIWWFADANGVRPKRFGSQQIERWSWAEQQFKGLLCDQARVAVPTGKRRRLADGLQRTLAGFGNAIVPQVAAEFIQAYLEAA